MTAELSTIAKLLSGFMGDSLTKTLAAIEFSARGITRVDCPNLLVDANATTEVLGAAAQTKRLAGQINVTIHALGILRCLPHILEPGETVDYVSLGAGNTGRAFDLETDRRVAEFKFIHWKGGPEAIRQNGVFKDFFLLAESDTPKQKYLYVLGDEHPLKFLNGRRAVRSVISHNGKLREHYLARFGERFATVRDYYLDHRDIVRIVDVSPWLAELAGEIAPDASDAGAV